MADNMIHFLRSKDYEMINDNLGHGSFGKTVLLRDPFIGELFVAKKYDPEFVEDRQEFYVNFLQEIKIMYKLNHRNVVRIYNYYAYPDQFTGYILMEYIEGNSIEKYIRNLDIWDLDHLDDVFTQLIDGFCYIEEQGIIHRDIREGNILVDRNGIAKIIDFGLGKTFKPVEKDSADSRVDDINRSGLEKLPNEYYEGRYTSRTDMFYLAELYHRLLREVGYLNEFSYGEILIKMMEEDENNRFESFAEVKNAIEEKRFSAMNISDIDKQIYQSFANSIWGAISCYTSYEKEFVDNVSDFIERIRTLIEKNCYETFIQNNPDAIHTVVKSFNFKYYTKKDILVDDVKRFYTWLQRLSDEEKQRVLNNIIAKLSSIETKEEIELPF